MRKILKIAGVIIAIAIIYCLFGDAQVKNINETSIISNSTSTKETGSIEIITPEPTFIPEWSDMSYEEKVQYYQDILLKHIADSDLNQKSDISYSTEYCLLVQNDLVQEAREKYDIAFKKKTRVNVEYLLFDFDTNDFMLLYQSKYERHYGKFTGNIDSDWQLIKNNDPFVDGYIYRYKNKKLYQVVGDGIDDSGYIQCEMNEPLKYILSY